MNLSLYDDPYVTKTGSRFALWCYERVYGQVTSSSSSRSEMWPIVSVAWQAPVAPNLRMKDFEQLGPFEKWCRVRLRAQRCGAN